MDANKFKADSLEYTIRANVERLDNFQQPIPALGYFLTSIDGVTFSQNTAEKAYGVTWFDKTLTACDAEHSASAPAVISFSFSLQDCNEAVLRAIATSSVDTADRAVYARLALAKQVFIFEIE